MNLIINIDKYYIIKKNINDILICVTLLISIIFYHQGQ
jgi:hypothetical protein